MAAKKKILIVDDEQDANQELYEILMGEGYDVLLADNGERAKKNIAQNSLDLVLLDLKLPDVDGLDLIKNIKDTGRDTYIIVITAFGSLDSAKRAIKENVYDYVTKPFNPEKLIGIIKAGMEKQKIERILREKMAILERYREITINATVERELRLTQLKKEIADLKKQLGKN